jgi:MFS family permease
MRGPFENSEFRRLFAGRIVTNVGDSFYFVAAMWLVYELTGNAFYSGLAGFLTLAPSALQFLAGPLVDRWSIRRTLTGTQAVQAVVVLAVPLAAAYGVLSVWVILAVMPALAALNQLVYPAQTAALPRLLDDDDLVAANSAFAVAYQGVDMVANAAGGALIALVGGVALFALDAFTFGAAALLFATVAVPPAGESAGGTDSGNEVPTAADGGDPNAEDAGAGDPGSPTDYLEQLREGASVLRGTFLAPLIAGAAVLNLAAGMTLAAMPAYADALGAAGLDGSLGGAGAYGILMAAFAGGNLLGALGANVVSNRPFGRILVYGFACSAVLWSVALAADWLPVTALVMALAFVPAGAVNVQLAAVVQSAVPDRLVGRVSSTLGSASAAAIPVGSLVGGAVAGAFGPRTALWATAAGFALLSAFVLTRPSLRGLPVVEQIEIGGDLG